MDAKLPPRLCWVCFDTDPSPQAKSSSSHQIQSQWVSPCLCRGDTQWVHQHCIQRWIDAKQNGNSLKAVYCPQCQHPYRIKSPPQNPILLSIRLVDSLYEYSCPFACIGIICGSIYTACWAYGACTFVQVMGGGFSFGMRSSTQAAQEYARAVKMIARMDAIRFYVTIPLIPVALLLPEFLHIEEVYEEELMTASNNPTSTADSSSRANDVYSPENSDGDDNDEGEDYLAREGRTEPPSGFSSLTHQPSSSRRNNSYPSTDLYPSQSNAENSNYDDSDAFPSNVSSASSLPDSSDSSDAFSRRIVTSLLLPTFSTSIGNILFAPTDVPSLSASLPLSALPSSYIEVGKAWILGTATSTISLLSRAASSQHGSASPFPVDISESAAVATAAPMTSRLWTSLTSPLSLLPKVDNPLQRAILGGLVYFGISKLLAHWMKSDQRYRHSRRRVLSFSEDS